MQEDFTILEEYVTPLLPHKKFVSGYIISEVVGTPGSRARGDRSSLKRIPGSKGKGGFYLVEATCVICEKVFRRSEHQALKDCKPVCSKACQGVLAALSQKRRSSIEIKMYKLMIAAGLSPVPQYPIGDFVADFAFPAQNVAVECDGDYWHNRPKVQERDRRKNAAFADAGWRVIRLWEHQIEDDPEKCIKLIQETLCG